MSLRPPVDRRDIEQFLRKLGERYHGAGRVYLVGGTSLVFEGFRQQTLDVDLTVEASHEDLSALIEAIRQLKVDLEINVEEASPGDFIPLPAGYADRHVYIGRFGRVDVFHFDLYSTALSKIARGRQQDYQDVITLLQQRNIDWTKLEQYFHQILPQMGLRSLKQDPHEFELNFQALVGLWRAAGGNP